MNILTDKNNVIIHCTNNLQVQSNGHYYRPEDMLSIPPELCTVFQVSEYPSDLQITKYCYNTDTGFYVNPEWVEPQIEIPDEIKDAVIDEIQKEVISNDNTETTAAD